MMRHLGVGVLVIASLLLVPSVTSAQAISGTVTDATGNILPGVTVEARSPVLIEQVRTALTNGAGQYQIVELRPGTYSVTYTLTGFSTLVREGIELTSGFTANIDVQLRVGTITETVIVTGATPLVDVQNVTKHTVATREIIDTIPAARSFQGLGVLIPGIVLGGQTNNIIQDVGGQSGQSHMTLAIHGGRTREQAVHSPRCGRIRRVRMYRIRPSRNTSSTMRRTRPTRRPGACGSTTFRPRVATPSVAAASSASRRRRGRAPILTTGCARSA